MCTLCVGVCGNVRSCLATQHLGWRPLLRCEPQGICCTFCLQPCFMHVQCLLHLDQTTNTTTTTHNIMRASPSPQTPTTQALVVPAVCTFRSEAEMSESWNFGSIMESRSTVEAVGLANGGMSPILGGGGGVCTLSSTALLSEQLASWLAS